MRKYALLALLAILPPVLSAARLSLRDGTVIYGQFISGTSQNIVFQDDNGVRRRFDLNQIQGIRFDNVTTGAARNDIYNNNNNPAYRDNNRNSAEWATLPAGTDL